jgi:precorrin-2 dehydrogenase/sirohydrochlorin ferrochelatase
LILDLTFEGKYVVIIGGGAEGYRKILSFLDAGSKILVVSRSFSKDIKELHQAKKIDLMKTAIKDGEDFINNLNPKPYLLIAVTNDQNLNLQLVKHAKSAGCMIYVADSPLISDFIVPAVTKIGDVKIAISTSGKSPAMARVLRKRIEGIITQEDLLQIKLQNYVRTLLKQRIPDQKVRRSVLHRILDDDQVKTFLKDGDFDKAEGVAMEILESFLVSDQNLQEARSA